MTLTIIIVACIIAVPFIVVLFQKDEYAISREIIINKLTPEVFDFIRHLKNMDRYNKWVMTDPNMKKIFTGTDGEEGFIYAWDSENKQAGKGEQEIKKITGNEKIEIEVRFVKPFVGTSYISMTTKDLPNNQTKVTSGFTGVKNYGMKVAHFVFNLEKVLGKDLQTTLDNLKNVLEK